MVFQPQFFLQYASNLSTSSVLGDTISSVANCDEPMKYCAGTTQDGSRPRGPQEETLALQNTEAKPKMAWDPDSPECFSSVVPEGWERARAVLKLCCCSWQPQLPGQKKASIPDTWKWLPEPVYVHFHRQRFMKNACVSKILCIKQIPCEQGSQGSWIPPSL